MRKCDNYLKISCYKYAPESFKAFLLTGYKGKYNNKPCYTEIPLTYAERGQCGYIFACNGLDDARAELKRVIRKRESKDRILITYGSKDKNNATRYYYTQQLAVNNDDINQRLYAYKQWKDYCQRLDWKLESYEVEEAKIDFDHPNKQPEKRVIYNELVIGKFIKVWGESNTIYKRRTEK